MLDATEAQAVGLVWLMDGALHYRGPAPAVERLLPELRARGERESLVKGPGNLLRKATLALRRTSCNPPVMSSCGAGAGVTLWREGPSKFDSGAPPIRSDARAGHLADRLRRLLAAHDIRGQANARPRLDAGDRVNRVFRDKPGGLVVDYLCARAEARACAAVSSSAT
jgi:hypothetical protein